MFAPMPGMGPMFPSRRDVEYLELSAREAEAEADADLDVFYELLAREAYADPEAEAEADDLDLYIRDAYLDDYQYVYGY